MLERLVADLEIREEHSARALTLPGGASRPRARARRGASRSPA
jgi:hypothetical protein